MTLHCMMPSTLRMTTMMARMIVPIMAAIANFRALAPLSRASSVFPALLALLACTAQMRATSPRQQKLQQMQETMESGRLVSTGSAGAADTGCTVTVVAMVTRKNELAKTFAKVVKERERERNE